MGWVGEPTEVGTVRDFCEQFGQLAREGIVGSAWVPGVAEYLEANYRSRRFALVTATPQAEMENILRSLDVSHWFCRVYGAPIDKAEALENALQSWECAPDSALMVGDSESDLLAARAAGVRFLLRRTPLNGALVAKHRCNWFDRL